MNKQIFSGFELIWRSRGLLETPKIEFLKKIRSLNFKDRIPKFWIRSLNFKDRIPKFQIRSLNFKDRIFFWKWRFWAVLGCPKYKLGHFSGCPWAPWEACIRASSMSAWPRVVSISACWTRPLGPPWCFIYCFSMFLGMPPQLAFKMGAHLPRKKLTFFQRKWSILGCAGLP